MAPSAIIINDLLNSLFDSEHEMLISEYVDKDFLESGLTKPIVCSTAMLLKFIESQ